ncbi:hypothetical protein DFR29_103338 [Tahibacter aquaticus]|uniref:Uncharacterized protein n=1 Tax=Tahibacter aquaticus TaxID=520092 RepID=A0A4R6Z542_9GAMM|nr:hypothetical protein [Tahibacter aquaticus]TDR46802.1 hypothetical protein DFR29_103338 [Tahibacter aquaticus]
MVDVFSVPGSVTVIVCGAVLTSAIVAVQLLSTKTLNAELAALISGVAGAVWYLTGLREWAMTTFGVLMQSVLDGGRAIWSVVIWIGGSALAAYLLNQWNEKRS